MIHHLSPSSLKKWESNREEWFLQYMTSSPKMKQTPPMAIGSAFDARTKKGIWYCLGRPDTGDAVFEQVMAGVSGLPRAEAEEWGDRLWQMYKVKGLARLLTSLRAGTDVRMETDLVIEHQGVRIVGKPDLFWSETGQRNVLDWKVTGMMSKQSPRPGYVWDSKTGEEYRGQSTKCKLGDMDWLMQVTTYGWMDGVCKSPLKGHIHQILPDRVVMFEDTIDLVYQTCLFDRYKSMWDIIGEGRIFDDLSPDQDADRQQNLRERSEILLRDSTFAMVLGR